ncbi:hypothetical protein BC567DRAFT_251662 [Phyllosticta citribraziliensis]
MKERVVTVRPSSFGISMTDMTTLPELLPARLHYDIHVSSIMPPHVPRKRSRSPVSPVAQRSRKRAKSSVFDALDASAHRSATAEDHAFLNGLGSDDDSSKLSDAESDDDFEDVPLASGNTRATGKHDLQVNGAAEDDDDEDEMDWEDALPTTSATPATDTPQTKIAPWRTLAGTTDDALEITLGAPQEEEDEAARTKALGIKGPSKKDRQLRMWIHCVHVQCLLFHNALRNAWCCDEEVHKALLLDLPDGVWSEVQRWRKDSGMPGDERSVVNKTGKANGSKTASKNKGKGKQKSTRQAERNVRDWGDTAERQEQGVPNMSGGDPLNRLLKYLAAYWKKRFRITAPGLRKKGYFPSAKSLAAEVKAWKDSQDREAQKGEDDSKGTSGQDDQEFGEAIRNKDEFIEAARRCEGSRDVGAQLFTALLRALGLEARLVCNLQLLGFGFTKAEDIVLKKKPPQTHSEPSSVNPAKSNLEGGFEKAADTPSKRNTAKEPKAKKPVLPSGRRTSTRTVVASTSDLLASFEPRGAAADKAKQVIAYVVAHSSDGTAKDVTVRYLKKHIWPGKTKGFRMPIEKIPIHNRRGKVKRYEEYDWFKDVMRGYTRDGLLRTKADEIEDEGDLVPVNPAQAKKNTGDVPETLQGYKNSAEYVLERHLRREEAIRPGSKPVKTFTTGKGDKAKSEPVFLRKDVVSCKTVESWHKEGRQIKFGEQPMKHVPTRAVTLVRKLEIEAAERESGEKPTQGLYAEEQTEWIIPPPIQNGIIPKNAFGNMDVTAPICRKLGIDYAEACTGFEFGNRRAVPILTGVVVAKENEQLVKDAWRAAQEAQRAKEEKKRQDKALKMWKKFILGLRIIERVREEYGDASMEAENPFAKKERKGELSNTFHRRNDDEIEEEEDAGPGGFFAPGEEEAVGEGGFLRGGDDVEGGSFVREDDNDADGGGFIVEGDDKSKSAPQLLANTSQDAPLMQKKAQPLQAPRRKRTCHAELEGVAAAAGEEGGLEEQQLLEQTRQSKLDVASPRTPSHKRERQILILILKRFHRLRVLRLQMKKELQTNQTPNPSLRLLQSKLPPKMTKMTNQSYPHDQHQHAEPQERVPPLCVASILRRKARATVRTRRLPQLAVVEAEVVGVEEAAQRQRDEAGQEGREVTLLRTPRNRHLTSAA